MSEGSSKVSPGIGSLNEKPLHIGLREWSARPGDRFEVDVDGFVVDILRDGLVVEIQTRSFASIKRKLLDLTSLHRVHAHATGRVHYSRRVPDHFVKCDGKERPGPYATVVLSDRAPRSALQRGSLQQNVVDEPRLPNLSCQGYQRGRLNDFQFLQRLGICDADVVGPDLRLTVD